jgi:phosphonate transport system substrate-binding protein
MRSGRVALALALAGAGGCALFHPETKTAPAPAAPAAAAAEPAPLPQNPTFEPPPGPAKPLVTLGMSAPTGQELAQFSADELNTYLSSKLGGPVATKLYDEAGLVDAISSGAIEAAWLTPPAYVRAAAKGGIQPIARFSRHGGTSYRSVIFVKEGTHAKALKDLKNRKFAWIGNTSASGGLYPRLILKKDGREPEKFFKHVLQLADHSEVCKAVLDGKADAGATFADDQTGDTPLAVDGCREAGFDPAKFKVIAQSDPIPNDVIAVRSDLPAEVESHLQAALLEMAASDKGKVQLRDIFHADGFGKSADADFEPVRDALRLSGEDLTPKAAAAPPATAPDAKPADTKPADTKPADPKATR